MKEEDPSKIFGVCVYLGVIVNSIILSIFCPLGIIFNFTPKLIYVALGIGVGVFLLIYFYLINKREGERIVSEGLYENHSKMYYRFWGILIMILQLALFITSGIYSSMYLR